MSQGENVIPPELGRSHVRSVVFTSDNAVDFTKALKAHGNYMWLGCAAHHINVIIKQGFKKNKTAAKLLKMCKINCAKCKSQPTSYI